MSYMAIPFGARKYYFMFLLPSQQSSDLVSLLDVAGGKGPQEQFSWPESSWNKLLVFELMVVLIDPVQLYGIVISIMLTTRQLLILPRERT